MIIVGEQPSYHHKIKITGTVSTACSGEITGNVIAYNTINGNKIQITDATPFSFTYEFLGATIDYSKYMNFSGLCFEAVNETNNISITATNSDPASLYFYYSDNIDGLNSNETRHDMSYNTITLTNKYDRIDGFSQGDNCTGSLMFKITADAPFNLFGTLNVFAEGTYVAEKNIELFTNNTYLENIFNLSLYNSNPSFTTNPVAEYENIIYKSCFSGCTNLKTAYINFARKFSNNYCWL